MPCSTGYHVRQLRWCIPEVVGSGQIAYDTNVSLSLMSSRVKTMSSKLGQPCVCCDFCTLNELP
jgi:hypothetical protein